MCIFVNIGTVYDLIFIDDIKQITKVSTRQTNGILPSSAQDQAQLEAELALFSFNPSYNRLRLHYNRLRLHYNRLRFHYNRLRLHYNRLRLHYNRLRLHYNRLRLHYNRLRLHYNRLRLHYNRLRLHYTRESLFGSFYAPRCRLTTKLGILLA
jgi:hypothetical protein